MYTQFKVMLLKQDKNNVKRSVTKNYNNMHFMWRHTYYPAAYSTPTLFHIVLVLKTNPMQKLPTNQRETATMSMCNIHIVHIQYMSTSWTTNFPSLQNTTLCMLLERQPMAISRDWTTTFTGS